MTYGTDTLRDFTTFHRGGSSRSLFVRMVPVAGAFAVSASLSAWVLHSLLDAAPGGHRPPAVTRAADTAPNPYGGLVVADASAPAAVVDPDSFAAPPASRRVDAVPVFAPKLLPPGPGTRLNVAAVPPEQGAPTASSATPLPPSLPAAAPPDRALPAPPPAVAEAANVPLPAPRPPELRLPEAPGLRPAPGRPIVPQTVKVAPQTRAAAPAAAADGGTLLQKLFGAPPGPTTAQPAPPPRPAPVLAYAAPSQTPDSGGFFSRLFHSGPLLPYDRETAVYDISAHTVYLPDGTRLEAHSGLGNRLDDPRHVSERDRGATPPHVYDLEPRTVLFHGVQALRLTPVGGGDIFGRTGLLAHSYMLGPHGDSNGCVSFKNYSAFLQAFSNGQIKHLAVVASLN